ncbi:hypothetical protein P9B03_03665 [Metasolibacillus meyeri]|uniref:Uncharacterized protein n=1 Tax=Metasolibacillus meyeri TaxID=1071052 RepID=A0AAW9NRY3_9BACL|nr:hypothetical protein [Metasolibacillus meyeri]MEC1177571.1 hypothetical protein [Metasolibacillus meyeri]
MHTSIKKILAAYFTIVILFILTNTLSAHANEIGEYDAILNQPQELSIINATNDTLETKKIDDELTATQQLDEPLVSPFCGSCDQKVYTLVDSWIASYDYNFGWHPGFNRYDRVSGYWFSNSSIAYGVSISYGFVSISVSGAGGTGSFINANYDKWSRPAVFGILKIKRYKIDEYNAAGIYLRTYYENRPISENTYVKVLYQ